MHSQDRKMFQDKGIRSKEKEKINNNQKLWSNPQWKNLYALEDRNNRSENNRELLFISGFNFGVRRSGFFIRGKLNIQPLMFIFDTGKDISIAREKLGIPIYHIRKESVLMSMPAENA